jgi:hypothetical protein
MRAMKQTPQTNLEQARSSQQARSKRMWRMLIMYLVLLTLVLGYMYYNRLSADESAPPQLQAPTESRRDAARFELKSKPTSAPSTPANAGQDLPAAEQP